MPVLTAWTPMSSTTLRYWARTASTGSSQAPCTPREFCAVTAVITLMPCTPSASIVFRSAWMPAPPPESEPADGEDTAAGGTALPPVTGLARSSRSGPSRPCSVQGAPSTVTWGSAERVEHLADDLPAGGQLHVRREGRHDRVVLSPGEHPLQRVDADGLPDVVHLRGDVDRAGAEVDPDLAGLGDVPEVGDESVADVGHGGGAEPGRRGARVVRRFGAAVRLDEGARRAEAAGEHGESGRGPAQPAGDGDDVAGPGAGPGDGLLVAQVAERGDRDGDGVAAYDVAADHGGAGDLALVAQAVHQLGRPGDRAVRRGRRGRAAARSARRPWRRCRRGSARRPCGRRRTPWTSRGGSAAPPAGCRCWPRPCGRARPPPRRRRRGRAGPPGWW